MQGVAQVLFDCSAKQASEQQQQFSRLAMQVSVPGRSFWQVREVSEQLQQFDSLEMPGAVEQPFGLLEKPGAQEQQCPSLGT